MTLWDKHKEFSSDFLTKHHDYVLFDVLHHIHAFLLYPLNCSCKGVCACEESRAKIVLSLNVDLYDQAQERHEHPDLLYPMKLLFKIPEDSFFRKHYGKAYPVWLIQERFRKEDIKKNLKIVERLVWGLLRLAKTHEIIFGEYQASIKEAVEMILGSTPLKTKTKKLEKEDHLCGEKAYGTQLNTYKSVCHFIAAFKFLEEDNPSFSLTKPEQIKRFLSLSHWFRTKLLTLETPNIKEKSLFSEQTLLPLPSWVNSDDVHIPINPFEEKLQKIKVQLQDLT